MQQGPITTYFATPVLPDRGGVSHTLLDNRPPSDGKFTRTGGLRAGSSRPATIGHKDPGAAVAGAVDVARSTSNVNRTPIRLSKRQSTGRRLRRAPGVKPP